MTLPPDRAEAAADRDAELVSLRRSFRIGLVAVAAFLVAVGGLVGAFGASADRPAGVAERWLVAVSDSTRDGLEEDGAERAAEHGAGPDVAVRAGLVVERARADGESAFEEVVVGRAAAAGEIGGVEVRRVSFSVTPYESDPIEGYVFLRDGADGWEVVAVQRADDPTIVLAVVVAEARLEPGPPTVVIERPESAPVGFWIGTLALGVLIAVGCSVAVRAATPKPGSPAPSGAAGS